MHWTHSHFQGYDINTALHHCITAFGLGRFGIRHQRCITASLHLDWGVGLDSGVLDRGVLIRHQHCITASLHLDSGVLEYDINTASPHQCIGFGRCFGFGRFGSGVLGWAFWIGAFLGSNINTASWAGKIA